MGAPAAAADLIVRSDGADIHSGPWFMRVTALADDILRVRAAAAEDLPEDALLGGAGGNARPLHAYQRHKQSVDGIVFRRGHWRCESNAPPLRLIVSEFGGHVISAECPTGAVDRRGQRLHAAQGAPADEHFFGFG